MKFLITGATGLIGKEIVRLCKEKGHTVHYLTTNEQKIAKTDNYQGFYWNPDKGIIDAKCLERVDVIINLAGASIAKRWTTSYKKAIIDSRVKSLQLLYSLLSKNNNNVKQLISSSAIGIYPSSLTKEYTEDNSEINKSFLGKVVDVWEKETANFTAIGLEVSKVRIGVVLSKTGGALEQMAKPVKYGVGAPLGNGKQYLSWIHIEDVARIFLHIAENNLIGAFNAVGNNPVTNAKITKTIAKSLKKPLWLPNVPAFMLKLLLGEMASIVLESQKVSNKKIIETGFNFKFSSLESAVNDCFS
ncbi:MAG: TIGR01777 family oxidoreductase [Flavobacteriaceae bacterium]|nr:TIGR01777 family oxidoreductase [Flavobacteriaceae bacterium]